MLCLMLAAPYAVAAAPPRNCAVAAATRPEDSSPLYTGKLEGEGTIHSIRRCPVDDGEGDQVGHRIYAVDASRRQQSLWSASPLTLQARPGALFASDDYLKYDLDGQISIAVPSSWAAGDQKSLAVEWAPVGAKKCLVARVEILMGAEPTMTSFLVEDLDEVLELSD